MGLVGHEWLAIHSVLSLYAYSGLEFDHTWRESTSRLVGNDRGCVDMLFVGPINDPLAIARQALFEASKSVVRMDCGCVFLGVSRSFASGHFSSDAADPVGLVRLGQARDHGIYYVRLLYGDVHGVCQIHTVRLAATWKKIVSLALHQSEAETASRPLPNAAHSVSTGSSPKEKRSVPPSMPRAWSCWAE